MDKVEAKKQMGWEVARNLEDRKKTILERMMPEVQHIKAALAGDIGKADRSADLFGGDDFAFISGGLDVSNHPCAVVV